MLAFCLDRLGLDPAFLIGGEIPQLGGNARAGAGWLVVEGDESDRSVAALRPRDRDPARTSTSTTMRRSQRAPRWPRFSRSGSRTCRRSCAPSELEPVELELAVPGEHNRRNAAAALAALELAGVARARRGARDRRVRRRRPQARAARRGAAASRCSTATPTTRRSSPRISRRSRPAGRVLALFQPHLYSRTAHLAHEFGAALAAADAVCVTEIYPAREEPIAGRDRPADRRRARTRCARACASAGRRELDDAASIVSAWARAGRHRAHPRRRRRRACRPRAARGARMTIEEGVALARSRRSAPAGLRARSRGPRRRPSVEEALRWARERELAVADGRARARTCSSPTTASTRSSSSSRRACGRARRGRRSSRAGSGECGRAPSRARRRARRLRVRVRDPGTIGGGVWMNGGAYGGDFSGVARARARRRRRRQRLVHAGRARPLVPPLRPPPRPGRRRGRVRGSTPRRRTRSRRSVRELNAQRKAAQPTNRRTFGSVFKNPEHELSAGRMLEACGLKGHRIGGAQISPKHANFIENADGARPPTRSP